MDLAGRGLAVVLVVNEIVFYVVLARDQGLSARTDLPLQLTDAATIAAVIALWRPSPLAFELTYFWAFSATVQALLTPDLRQGFPDYRWWWFVIAHAGVDGGRGVPRLGPAAHPAAGRGRAGLRVEPRGGRRSPRSGRWPPAATTCSCAILRGRTACST